MQRGQYSLFTSVFPSAVESNPDNKGRRNVFLDKRDEALISRYYFYAQVKRKRYDDCLVELEKEFFITAGVITQRIDLGLDVLKDLVDKNVKVVYLKRKYPNWNWN